MTDLLSKLTYRYSPLIVQFLATAYSLPRADIREVKPPLGGFQNLIKCGSGRLSILRQRF